jgi:hypothetical protein
VSKSSTAETTYLALIRLKMPEGSIGCVCSGKQATDPHHPLGSFWESGKGFKAHDRFVIPLSSESTGNITEVPRPGRRNTGLTRICC